MNGLKIKILLVDDDEEDFFIIKDILSDIPDEPFELEWTSTFEEAKLQMQEKRHDVYLVDYRLGVHTGLDLISEILPLSSAPIILLTGQGDRNVDIEAMKRGADDYLVKSQMTGPLLERCIRYSINRSHIMKELKKREESLKLAYEERIQMEAQILQQDRLASIGLLASSLAHEIGTPLGVMRGRSELIMMQSASDVTNKNAKVILDQIDRISKLIRSLLTLARGDQTQTVVPVSVREVLDDVSDLIGHELSRKGIEIEDRVSTDSFVFAEAGALHQVFLNLLVNSMHAIQSVGPTRHHKIEIESKKTNSKWDIAVTDTGCGISNKNMKQLFKPFFTTKDIGSGTGLGLATSYRIVENWGGQILVSSEDGCGSTFTIRLKSAQPLISKSKSISLSNEGHAL